MCVNERAFSDVDLNSLLTLLVVHREQCVTRAAQCLNVKQPAVSNTLAKLRAQFGDPLFIRHCRGVRATARAIEIVEGLGPAFSQIEKVMSTASPCASHSFQASGALIDETT